jgi:hypothetical protein
MGVGNALTRCKDDGIHEDVLFCRSHLLFRGIENTHRAVFALLEVSQGDTVDAKHGCNFPVRCLPFFEPLGSVFLNRVIDFLV